MAHFWHLCAHDRASQWSTGVCSYAMMFCVSWQLSIIASITFFSNMCYSSSFVGTDQTSWPLLPTHISEPWVLRTLSPVHQLPFFGPLSVLTEHCIAGTPYKTWHFGDALTQRPSHHSLFMSKSLKSLHMPLFLNCFQHINFNNWLFTCYPSYPPWHVSL